MKIDDKIIEQMCNAYRAGHYVDTHDKNFMRAAAEVLQRLHEEELDRVLPAEPNRREFDRIYNEQEKKESCSKHFPRDWAYCALCAWIESRRSLIAPEPSLEEKISLLLREQFTTRHDKTFDELAREIVALLERKP